VNLIRTSPGSAAYFPIDEYHRRWSLVSSSLRAANLDAAVVWGRSAGTYDRCGDILYLTNYYSTQSGQGFDNPMARARGFSAVVLRPDEEPELVADDAWPRTDLISTGRIRWDHDVVRCLINALKDAKVSGRVGIVGTDVLPMKYWREIERAFPGVTWVDADDLVMDVRKIKSAVEIECYREAGRIVTRALDLLMKGLVTGRTEAEAAGDAAREVFRSGGRVHMIPVSHGSMIENFASDPLVGFSRSAPVPGDVVRAWVYGPIFQGYWLDPGRTAVAGGKPTADQRRLIETNAAIVETLIDMIRPGVSVAEVARVGDRLTLQAGNGVKDQAAEKWPSYGHGCGLTFERQQISLEMGDAGDVFEAGMVLGVEGFLTMDGVGSAGFEQNIVVGETGNELLTTSPVTWW
jgi:Xaa-Pro aminopeptidase